MDNIDNDNVKKEAKENFKQRISDVNFKIEGISDNPEIQKQQIEFIIKRKNDIYTEIISKKEINSNIDN